jgi:hypothetical protein
MDAQVAAYRESVVAVWMTPGTDLWGSGAMATALSSDGGRTWKGGPNPADDGSTAGHGFMDLAFDEAGMLHLVWLDSRDGRQGLRYARSSDFGGHWSENRTLKAATCECCSNALATGGGGRLAVLFRDGNPRDMAAAVSEKQGEEWLPAGPVGGFGWKVEGCPHVGGGLAFGGGVTGGAVPRLHAALWTGFGTRAGVYYCESLDTGRTWTVPRSMGGKSATAPDIAVNGALVFVAWSESSEGSDGVWGACAGKEGGTWDAPRLLSQMGVGATHPRVVAVGSGFRVFWTEGQRGGETVVASAVWKR